MAGRTERRRDRRLEFQQVATLVRGRTTSIVLTADVGFRGIQLHTDAPPPLRELVRVRLQLPPDGREFEVHGMAVWTAQPEAGVEKPGAGIQFFAVPHDVQLAWNDFIHWLATTRPEPARPAAPVEETPPSVARRIHPRVVAELQVRLQTSRGPQLLSTQSVSPRGMFLTTPRKLKVGSRVKLEILHPGTGAALPVEAVVRHRGERARQAGVGVVFVGLDEQRRDQLMELVLAALDAAANGGSRVAPSDAPRRQPVEEDFFAGLDLEP